MTVLFIHETLTWAVVLGTLPLRVWKRIRRAFYVIRSFFLSLT